MLRARTYCRAEKISKALSEKETLLLWITGRLWRKTSGIGESAAAPVSGSLIRCESTQFLQCIDREIMNTTLLGKDHFQQTEPVSV